MITKVGMKDNSLTTTVGFIAFLTWHSNSNLFSSSEWQVLTTDWNVSHTGQPINQVKQQASVRHYFAQTALQFKRGYWFLIVLPVSIQLKAVALLMRQVPKPALVSELQSHDFWAEISYYTHPLSKLQIIICDNCLSLLCHPFGYNPGCWI